MTNMFTPQMSPSDPGVPASEEMVFSTKFGDAAFNVLRTKFPQLTQFVITFKVIESDIDTGTALGTFVIRKGQEVVYVPVVMSDGQITSCEMFYDKSKDAILPIIDKTIEEVVAAARLDSMSLAPRTSPVEDTRTMFRQMFRPPASSNPVLASSNGGVHTLPNAAKDALSAAIEGDKDLLCKIAKFYSVQSLASKLAKTPSADSCCKEAADTKETYSLPTVLELNSLTKQIQERLSAEQKGELLAKEYLITSAGATSTKVVPKAALFQDLLFSLGVREVEINDLTDYVRTGTRLRAADNVNGTGIALRISSKDNSVTGDKVVIINGVPFTKGPGGVIRITGTRLVVAGFVDTVSLEDLKDVGFIQASDLVGNSFPTYDVPQDYTVVAYQKSKGDGFALAKLSKYWNHCVYDHNGDKRVIAYSRKHHSKYVDGKYVPYYEVEAEESYTFTDKLDSGILLTTNVYGKGGRLPSDEVAYELPANTILPITTCLAINSHRSKTTYFQSMSSFVNYVRNLAHAVSVRKSGAGFEIIEGTGGKTQKLPSLAKVAEYLVDTHNVSASDVDLAIKAKDVLLFKEAFDSSVYPGVAAGGMQGAPQAQAQAPADYHVDQDMLRAAAATEDPEIMDVGMLASLSNNADIKEALLDLLPSFLDTTTKLGKSILLFCVHKTEMEQTYGVSDYNTTIGNNRKIFKMLGTLVYQLTAIINMK